MQATTGILWGLRRVWHELVSRPFVRHVGVLTVANAVGAVLSFAQGILVARWLGPELYGIAALVMSVPALVYTFFDARSAEASVKYLSEFHARGEKQRAAALCRLGYMIDFGVATLAFLGVLSITPWASRAIVHRPELGWLLIIYAASFLPRSLQGTSYAVLAVHNRFPTVALMETVVTVTRVALVLGFVLAGWNVAGVIWGTALSMALAGLLYIFSAWPLMSRSWGMVSWRGVWFTLKGYRRELVRFLAYNDLNALLGMIPKQLDIVLLGYFRNPTEVGYYKLAKTLAGTINYLVDPLQRVTYPRLAQLWAVGNVDAIRRHVKQLALRASIVFGLMGLIGILIVPVMMPFLLGADYNPAILATQIILVGAVVGLVFFWIRPQYLARGYAKQWFILNGVVIILLAFTYPIFVLHLGYLGASIWLLLMYILGHGAVLFWLWRSAII